MAYAYLAMPLTLFSSPIDTYSTADLNAALYTVFGEISPTLHDKLKAEAEAVASTIFNRLQKIIDARKADEMAQTALVTAKKIRDAKQAEYDSLGKSPTAVKKKLREEGVKQIETEYARRLQEAKAGYDAATRALGAAQTVKTQINSAKVAAESYVAKSARSRNSVTLTDIVTAPAPDGASQYMGYAKGTKDYKLYSQFLAQDQERNDQRWATARKAIEDLARDPKKRAKYVEFRSNRGGKRDLGANQIRIGGNDFW
jgi:hypothetical protein